MRISTAASGLIVVAATGYFIHYVHQAVLQDDVLAMLSLWQAVAIVACSLVYLVVMPITAWGWRQMLRSMGFSPSTLELTMILGLTQPSKYLPGNIFQHVSRGTLALRRGIPIDAYVGTAIAETLLAVVAGVVIGLACIGLSDTGYGVLSTDLGTILFGLVGMILALVAIVLLLPIWLPVLARQLRVLTEGPGLRLRVPSRTSMVACLGAYAANFVLIGAGLIYIAESVPTHRSLDSMLLVGAFCIAWTAGFLTPGAPAGLGVREGVMAAILGPLSGAQEALVVILGLRLATTLGDALSLALGGVLLALEGRRRRQV